MRYAIAFHGPNAPRAEVMLDDSAQPNGNDFLFYDDAEELINDNRVKTYDLVKLYNRYASDKRPDNSVDKAEIAEAVIELLSDTFEIHKRGRTITAPPETDSQPDPPKAAPKPRKAASKAPKPIVEDSTNQTDEASEPWDEAEPGQAFTFTETPKKRGRPAGSKNKPKPQRQYSRIYKYLEPKKARKSATPIPIDPLLMAGRLEIRGQHFSQEARAQWQRERAEARAQLWADKLKNQPRRRGGRQSQFPGKLIFPAPKCMGTIIPRRRGSAGYESMAIVIRQPGLTFEEFLEKGGRVVDLRLDLNAGNVVLRDAPEQEENKENEA